MLLLLIAAGTGWLLVHFALLIRTVRAPGISLALRVLAFLPPATPIAGWLAGARGLSAAWVAFGVLYVVLRSTA